MTLIRAQQAGHAWWAYGLSDQWQIFPLARLDEATSIRDDESSAIVG